jgi:hypothetical protein
MGNRSKRGRPDPDAPDPVAELREASRWSGFTRQNILWAHTPGSRPSQFPRKLPLPGLGAWFGILIVVLLVLGAVYLLIWLPSLFLD